MSVQDGIVACAQLVRRCAELGDTQRLEVFLQINFVFPLLFLFTLDTMLN